MKSLDFFVFGVARSGTTALANALNLHPRILCGIECFQPASDHSNLEVPQCFFDKGIVGEKKAEKNLLQKQEKPDLLLFGNKFPRYYLHLDRVVNETGGAIPIGVYRESLGFVPSWNKRAEVGTGWHKGRVGITGIIEQLLFFSSLVNSRHDSRIFSYSELFFNDINMIDKLYASVGAEFSKQAHEKFMRNIFNNQGVASKERVFTEIEKDAIDRLEISEVDFIFKENSGQWFSSYHKKIIPAYGKMINCLDDLLPEWLSSVDVETQGFLKSQLGDYKLVSEDVAVKVGDALKKIGYF